MKASPRSPGTATGRFEALDGWRGVCACMVVMLHTYGYSPLSAWPLVRNSYLFVDFFFVLSGFVISWNYATRLDSWQGVKRFLVLRLGRLYPLHFFMLLCFVAWETAKLVAAKAGWSATSAFIGNRPASAILTNVFLIQSLDIHDWLTWNAPSWSISTEWWTYVVFALIAVWFGMRTWMLVVAAIALPPLLLTLSHTGMDTNYDYGFLRCILGFALGIACHRIHNHWPARASAESPGVMTMVECLAVGGVIAYVSMAGTSAWSFLAPFVFALAILVFADEAGLVSRLFRFRLLKWLGTLSYSIYLTHLFVIGALHSVLHPFAKRILHQELWTLMPVGTHQYMTVFGRNNLEGTLFYALVLGLTLAFSAFTYRWVETPGREWTRRWLQARRQEPSNDSPAAPDVSGHPAGGRVDLEAQVAACKRP